jgi:hypothetical protein
MASTVGTMWRSKAKGRTPMRRFRIAGDLIALVHLALTSTPTILELSFSALPCTERGYRLLPKGGQRLAESTSCLPVAAAAG